MGFEPGDELVGEISQVTNRGDAIVELDSEEIHLGHIPHVRGAIPLRIQRTEPYCVGEIRLSELPEIRLIPTPYSAKIRTEGRNNPSSTVLHFGTDREVIVDGKLELGVAIVIELSDTSDNLIRGTIRSSNRVSAEKQSVREIRDIDGRSVKDLVERLEAGRGKERNSERTSPGGTAREKYSCKCCGAQVDIGSHQCGLCQQAGCSPWKRLCRFA